MKYVLCSILLLVSAHSFAATDHLTGKINNISSIQSGLLVALDTGAPDNCTESPEGWMLVKQEHTAITSLILAAWTTANTDGVIHTETHSDSEYCVVRQFNPK